MQSIRIAVLTTSYPLHAESSSGIFVKRLIENLPEAIKATVIVPADDAVCWAETAGRARLRPFRYAPRAWRILAHQPGGVPVALKRNPALYFLLPALLVGMSWTLWRTTRDASAIQANWVICGVVAGFFGKLLGRPVLTTLRGEDVTRAQRSRIDGWLLTLCVRWSTCVVGVSDAIVDWLRQEFPAYASKFLVIENGVPDELLAIPRTSTPPREPIELVTVGSLIPRKGFDQIIDALARLPSNAQWHLTVVGAGPEDARLRERAHAAGISRSVSFVGALAPERVPDRLASADIFLLASHAEGRPNAVLEAMAAALPVVATDIPGVNEIVRHEQNGLLFRDGDLEGFATHLTRLMTNSALRGKLGENGRKWIIDRGLTWQSTGQRYAELLNTLME